MEFRRSSEIRELVVISGKGGTGKTSITASFAVLAQGEAILADCDVDAADLHLVLVPEIIQTTDFISGREAIIRNDVCTSCGLCEELCRFDSVTHKTDEVGRVIYTIEPTACEGCGVCVRFCPAKAIDFPDRLCGKWMVSDTRCGTMVHARLAAGGENSGKLVSLVRSEARKLAETRNHSMIITDGPPGIGCAVIASITGASEVLVVTEPTVAGEHDLERVLALAHHFEVPAWVCVNKWDINPEVTERIEKRAESMGARVAGRVRYDRAVTLAQIQSKAVVEIDADCAEDIRKVWQTLQNTKQ